VLLKWEVFWARSHTSYFSTTPLGRTQPKSHTEKRLTCWPQTKAEVFVPSKAGLKVRVLLTVGPYYVIHDVIVCKSYVFADSQGSRLLFLVVENMLNQQHIQSAARRENLWYKDQSVFLLRKSTSRLECGSARNNIHPNNKQKLEVRNKNAKKITFHYIVSLSLTW